MPTRLRIALPYALQFIIIFFCCWRTAKFTPLQSFIVTSMGLAIYWLVESKKKAEQEEPFRPFSLLMEVDWHSVLRDFNIVDTDTWERIEKQPRRDHIFIELTVLTLDLYHYSNWRSKRFIGRIDCFESLKQYVEPLTPDNDEVALDDDESTAIWHIRTQEPRLHMELVRKAHPTKKRTSILCINLGFTPEQHFMDHTTKGEVIFATLPYGLFDGFYKSEASLYSEVPTETQSLLRSFEWTHDYSHGRHLVKHKYAEVHYGSI